MAGRSIPIGYLSNCEHIIPTIVFLASDKVEFVTGAVIAVDRGYVRTCNCPWNRFDLGSKFSDRNNRPAAPETF